MTEFWRRWLMVAAMITGLAGLGFAAVTAVGATGVHDTLFDLVYLPGELQAPAGDVASFAMGVAGAVIVGWAATMLLLLRNLSTSALPTTWRALTVGLLTWFVVDGIVTIAAGATGNLVLNLAFVAMFGPALVATRPGRVASPDT